MNVTAPRLGAGFLYTCLFICFYLPENQYIPRREAGLCHQAPCTSRQFTNVYELLSRAGFRAIGVDMPGFGESDPLQSITCIEVLAPAIVAVLDHLEIEKSDILGHRTGAILASEISCRFPDRIRKVILNGPFVVEDETELKKWLDIAREEIDFEYSKDGSHLNKRFSWPSSAHTHPSILTRRTVEQFQGYAPFWTGYGFAFLCIESMTVS